jgi:hypothetical protein
VYNEKELGNFQEAKQVTPRQKFIQRQSMQNPDLAYRQTSQQQCNDIESEYMEFRSKQKRPDERVVDNAQRRRPVVPKVVNEENFLEEEPEVKKSRSVASGNFQDADEIRPQKPVKESY